MHRTALQVTTRRSINVLKANELGVPNIQLFLALFLQSFSLEFYFEPNEFFTNTLLTKTYKMRSEPDENDPFSFDGPEIMGCTG